MSWPDPYGPHFRQIGRYMADVNRVINRSLQSVAEVAEAWRRELDRLPIEEIMVGVQHTAEAAQQAFRRSLPPNWMELDFDLWDDAVALGAEHGVNVLWAPRIEIIHQLIEAADDRERMQILIERETHILDDIDEVLSDVGHPDLGHLPDLGRKAVAAQRDGHQEAGQALAAAVLTGVVQLSLGFERLAEARERFHQDDPMESGWSLFSLRAILHTLGRALHQTEVAPPGFNRHGSLHALPSQYTRVHATAAMLLIAGVLGELQGLLTERDAEAAADAEAA